MGSLRLLPTMNHNAATASLFVNTFHQPDVLLIVNGAPSPVDEGAR